MSDPEQPDASMRPAQNSASGPPPPGTGYFVAPSDGPGPGVLLIPSPWGLTRSFKQRADSLAEAGFSVLAPDLNDGRIADSEQEAADALLEMDMNVAASLVQSSLRLLRSATVDSDSPVGVVGFAAGASWALWLAERSPDEFAAVVGYYGTQAITFERIQATVLLYFGTADSVVGDDEVAMLGLNLQLAKCDFRVERHPGMEHGFAERERDAFAAATDAVAWRQSLELLAATLKPHQ